MRGICPNCEREVTLAPVDRREEYNVRGEPILVDVHLNSCTECGAEFSDPKSTHDPLDDAYREYRARRNLIQPEGIRRFRTQQGLSQRELTALLGWGGATLSRYENGALQSEAHDTLLRLAMDPANLLKLVQANPSAIDDGKRADLLAQLGAQMREQLPLRAIYEERFGRYPADAFSGYRTLDLDRFYNAVLYFCGDDGVAKTKLNRLLFYADFEHYKDYTVSITGMRYARLPFGPVPDNYEFHYAVLCHDEKALYVEERSWQDCVWEVLVAARAPDLGVFGTTELKILATVKERFAGFTADAISRLSHRERGYVDTANGALIAYDYASSLSE